MIEMDGEPELSCHEAANLFPLMTGDEFEALKEDIVRNGLIEPIWLHPDGSILDGRNRYRACRELGIKPHYATWNGTGSPVSFVVSMNMYRRHLTEGQKACVAVDILPLLEKEAKERQGVRNDLVEKIPQSDMGKARDQAADIVGVNSHYVSDAKKIKKEAHDLFIMVRCGAMNIPEAKSKLDQRTRLEARRKIIKTKTEHPLVGGLDGWMELYFRMIEQAVKDAAEEPKNTEVREWLCSEFCLMICEEIGLPHQVLVDWVESNCRTTPAHMLMLEMLDRKRYKNPVERSMAQPRRFSSMRMR
jgi:hypothetical protein